MSRSRQALGPRGVALLIRDEQQPESEAPPTIISPATTIAQLALAWRLKILRRALAQQALRAAATRPEPVAATTYLERHRLSDADQPYKPRYFSGAWDLTGAALTDLKDSRLAKRDRERMIRFRKLRNTCMIKKTT